MSACLHQFEPAPSRALHMTKVAVGCPNVAALQKRHKLRAVGGEVALVTRFMPKRADELIGGSLFWIVKHQLVARQTILGFDQREEDKRAIIRLQEDLVAVRAFPKRAHQGWRYLDAADAPPDLGGGSNGIDALPASLIGRLTALALL